MFHSSHIHMPNRYRHRNALRTFFPSSSFSPPDSKEPLRRGILFSSVATVLLLVGAILTWLGFNDVFGGKISMTGPLLIALALLMLLLSLRQFMLAKKRNRTTNGPVQMETMNSGGVAQVAADLDDINGTATIVVEAWDSEEPNTDPIPSIFRNGDELAPPSYTDIAQSFNSNSPSFFSHDDHNEAPPTYEETCAGMYPYASESSLTHLGSRRCSAQFDRSPSPRRTGQGYFFQNDSYVSHTTQPRRLSNTLCPSTAVSMGQSQRIGGENAHVSFQRKVKTSMPAPCAGPDIGADNCLVSSSTLAPVVSSPDSHTVTDVSHIVTDVTKDQSNQWSRRSFSSIPSYTCLLSESGEVSAQVFNTSSIIEEMMPSGGVYGKDGEITSPGLLSGPSGIPTRSHSLTSVHTMRQGVPYSNIKPSNLQSSPTSFAPLLPNQPLYDQQPLAAVLGHPPNSSNKSGQILYGSPYHQGPPFRKASDSNILDLLGKQLPPIQGQTSSEFHSSSSVGVTPRQPMGEAQDLSPHRESPSSLSGCSLERSGSFKRESPVIFDSPGQAKLLNTQDVQETI